MQKGGNSTVPFFFFILWKNLYTKVGCMHGAIPLEPCATIDRGLAGPSPLI
eukprot:COSAG01_NODE_1065_length_11883_cov_104.177868_5_plen_51_part_00